MAEPARPPVRAAGAVLWRPAAHADGVEVAVVHRPKYDDWSLPKGKLDPGELPVAAAVREVREETGFTGPVGRSLGVTRYVVEHDGAPRPKTVSWWAMQAEAGAFAPNQEVDELRWAAPAAALGQLTRSLDAEPLECFLRDPAPTTPLLLLRHGSAGSRRTWDGDDDDRPLDKHGRVQGEAACGVVPLYGVRRLVTAPLERCAATLRPLADRLGVQLELEPALAARSWAEDPERTVDRLLRLVHDGVPAAVCSQGEVVPGAVAELARRSGLRLHEPAAAKGSLWSLSFDAGRRLVDADYLESLLP